MALVRLIYLGFLEKFPPPSLYIFIYFCIFFILFDAEIHRVMGLSSINFRTKKDEKHAKYIKISKDGGGEIF